MSDMLFRNRPSASAKRDIEKIDAAFSRAGRTGESIVTWRGVNPEPGWDWSADFPVGGQHVSPGFWASRDTYGSGYGRSCEVQVELTIPKGSKFVWVAPFSSSGASEREVLGPRNIIMNVTSKERKPPDSVHSHSWWHIKAELIDDGTA
jgi:hypothetical protein